MEWQSWGSATNRDLLIIPAKSLSVRNSIGRRVSLRASALWQLARSGDSSIRPGKYVINTQFQDARPFLDGLAAVKINNKYGFIDKTGKLIIPHQFDNVGIWYFAISEGLISWPIPVQVSEKWGFIDQSGNYVINPQYDDASSFREGLAAVKKDGKYGFVDTRGKFVINPQFEGASYFSEGLAAVSTSGKTGFIDKSGTYVINPQFESASHFTEGLSSVTVRDKDNKYLNGYIDQTGKYVFGPTEFEVSKEN